MYGAYRPATEDTYYWRLAQFMFPFFTLIPTGALGTQIIVRSWVPLDDTHTMFWTMVVPDSRHEGTGPRTDRRGQPVPGTTSGPRYAPATTDWLGRWRLQANEENDYRIDREVQRTASYTGIDGIHLQDQAITESMGTLFDRTIEHLGSSDAMVIRTRKRLIGAAIALRDPGAVPPGVDAPAEYRRRSGGAILPRSADWLEATAELRNAPATNFPAPR